MTEDLVNSLIHTTNQRIKTERVFLKDMMEIKKKFGWKWANHDCEGGDEIDQARVFGNMRNRVKNKN